MRSLPDNSATSTLPALKRAAIWAGVSVAVSLVASGYPTRVGLTKSQALISLPGDLVLPTAQVQADRAIAVKGTPEDAWPLLLELGQVYSNLWGLPLEEVYMEEPRLLVLRSTQPTGADALDQLWTASVALTLDPSTDGTTTVHVRERYRGEGFVGRAEARGQLFRSAVTVRLALGKMKRELGRK